MTPKNGRDPLLAAICHDLRAPLAAVTMGANFVLQTTSNDEASARSRRILEAMLRSCAQMERLVRNFADLSEIEGGSVTLRLGVHDAGEMAELTAEAAADSARAKGVAIEVTKPDFSLTVQCDRERILRALGHLLENAIRFAPAQSKISLQVTSLQKTQLVSFTITDHGPGISAEVRENIFDREWHAKRASRVGTGFGLSIARGFASAHGGELTFDSQENVATSFVFTIPVEGPREEGQPVPSSARAYSVQDDPRREVHDGKTTRARGRTPSNGNGNGGSVTPSRRRRP
ncbi:Osmosensitive K+ channel histidine kinase KdpD [Labilithrix luteola]|uniref:histidine kinase n=1 Tax=Labilithrix luteola TaxID=1391654 RepID=A0A0K1PTU5_9BACT|nr:HAMP domain-containing sensor histidine kinase [Labilithrix luteola]AKU96955.1 Osmosensitive K+ channel histidine kinase KdpD [Labilithrix luteola]